MISNIPDELKKLQQWVCFDIQEGKKIPYTPGSDNMAASNRPRDWRSFRAALADVKSGRRQHLGFCFASSDPYVFIDLDDPGDPEQVAVFERIRTYAQRSISGKGCHLICKGTFDGPGRHPSKPAAGMFKENRFCLMTGDVSRGRNTIKPVDQEELQSVHSWLSTGSGIAPTVDLVEYQAEIPDQTVLDMGRDRFPHKFESLCRGDWRRYEEFHNDHSTADHAFTAMLCDLTESNEQVRWFFHASGMWTEERENKKAAQGHSFENYVNRTITKIRSTQARDADRASKVQIRFIEDEEEAQPVPLVVHKEPRFGARDMIDALPDGLLKELAEYSFATAYLPLQEASLVGPLTLLSAIIGRGYVTPTNSGLNLWNVVVGRTGCGKDELQKSVKRILAGIANDVPHIRRIFGGELVSGPAIETTFQDTFRFVSYFKEFGKTFATLASPNAQEHTRTLVGGLLNSYNASDIGGSLESRKKAKNEGERSFIERPCLCLLGDSTPGELYDAVSTRELASGFLQRFMLFDVKPESWSMHANPNSGGPLPKRLADNLSLLTEMMERFDADPKQKPRRVKATPECLKRLEEYALKKRQAIRRQSGPKNSDEVYNRAGLKVGRLATIAAVCADFHAPVIDNEHVDWAIALVESLDASMLNKFTSGKVGTGQVKQEAEILAAAEEVCALTKKERMALGMPEEIAKLADFLPLSALKNAVVQNATFTNDKNGAVTAFEKCVASMVKAGVFSQVDPVYAADSLGFYNKGTLLTIQR